MEVLSEDEAACRNVIGVVATGWHSRCLQVWVNKGSVTCLPRLEPPLFSVPFALAAFRFRSAQCLVHETPLTPPVPPRVAGFFMGTRYRISCYRPERWRNARVWRRLPITSKHRASTGRNVAEYTNRLQSRQPSALLGSH